MIGAWMVYALVVSTLFGVGAAPLERGARLARVPGRWIWAGAMAASLVLPALARTTPPEPAPDAPRIVAVVDALVPTALPRSDGLAMLHVPLLLLWLAGSVIVASLIFLTHRRVAREVRRYVPGSLDGVQVRRTAGFGPAVVGLVRSVIVIPTWIDLLDDGARRLILRHEQEHQRVGDSRLLFAATLAVALQPWNLALWWQLCRLRDATELDCDRRVLGSGVDIRAYGQLLLAMSRRRPPSPFAAVALSNAKNTLDRRITAMTMHHTRGAYARALCAASLGAVLITLGCKTPSPVEVADTSATNLVAAADSPMAEPATSAVVTIDLPEMLSRMDSLRGAEVEIDPDTIERIEILKHLRTLYEEGAIQLRPADGATDECPTLRAVAVLLVGESKEERKVHIKLYPCDSGG